MLAKTIVRKKMKRKIDRKKERNALDQHIIAHSRVVPFEISIFQGGASQRKLKFLVK